MQQIRAVGSKKQYEALASSTLSQCENRENTNRRCANLVHFNRKIRISQRRHLQYGELYCESETEFSGLLLRNLLLLYDSGRDTVTPEIYFIRIACSLL